ncbi:MAG: SMC-Scp complex subunit ScpB [SAR324 cluster bacterium]|nr:SMC-Scp complex subunit ScpB [SAR324 cluster bacterium]
MIDDDAKKVLEAVLFSTAEVLTAQNLAAIVGNATPSHIRSLTQALNDEYERTGRTFRIVPIAGGFQMRTLPLYRTWVKKTEPLKPVRLSQPALETLSIVAYRQPVTRAEVEHLRGVDVSHSLRSLLERKLIRILGKDKAPGRPILYGTSREFLSLFNLNDLKELPTLEDLDLAPAPPEAKTTLLPAPGQAAAEPAPPPAETEPELQREAG